MIGSTIHNALESVGITPERVERWLGAPCGCKERQDKLDALGFWAKRKWSGVIVKVAALEALLWE